LQTFGNSAIGVTLYYPQLTLLAAGIRQFDRALNTQARKPLRLHCYRARTIDGCQCFTHATDPQSRRRNHAAQYIALGS
jgi:hypothetical protein